MSVDAPTVSVVMAAYNGAPFLRETIASLSVQTMADFEIVVVDDCSTDDTLAVLASIDEPRLRVVQAAVNGGPAVARTLAMAHARGRFIAGLDQDDLCREDRFARQIAYLHAHPDVVLVGSAAEPFGVGTLPPDYHAGLDCPGFIDWRMMLGNPLVWSSVMMRGDAARALDPFERDEVRYAEDFDLYHRIRAFGRLGRLVEPLVRYRHHAAGVSKTAQERMIRSAGAVLTWRYAEALGANAERAGVLMSRYAAARLPVPDAATLIETSAVLSEVVSAFSHLAPDRAHADADALWWRIARTGLRAGLYGGLDLLRARAALIADTKTMPSFSLLPDLVIGVGRRLAKGAGRSGTLGTAAL